MVSLDKDDIFMTVVNRWRSLGGTVAAEKASVKSIVEEGDETKFLNADWIYLTPGDGTLEQVKRPDCTRVLDATFGKPGREGIESWGDWEIYVDRVEKSESCRDLVDLTLAQIGAGCRVEYGDEDSSTMLGASAFMRRMEPTWDEVLDKMGRNLKPDLFGAENTEVKACVTFEEDGNEFVGLVDVVGEFMYVCSFCTS